MRKSTFILLAVIIVLVVLAIFQGRQVSRLSGEVERQKSNVKTLRENETIYKICDSIKVAEIQALQLDKDQFDELIKEKDKQLNQLRDQRKKDVEFYSKLYKTDTFIIDNSRIDTIYINDSDTCVGYMDNYITYLHCNNETIINTNDTIKQVVSKHYKHKFLWWKWKVDGFTQDLWSTNPHSNLHFVEFVKVQK